MFKYNMLTYYMQIYFYFFLSPLYTEGEERDDELT